MELLRKDGWHINESQTSELFTDGILPKTSNEILKTILNEDLRDFGEPSIINLLRKDDNRFDGPCVLQLLRYRNVSVPRIKEEMNQADPTSSIIRLFFTDGHTSISAIVLEQIPGINADTPPGTKILINGRISVEGTFLILTKKDVRILGGRVPDLIEKWNVEKNSVRADGFKAKSAAGKGTAAPKWVSFGKRGQKNAQLEKGFKANTVMPKNIKEGDDADDFAKNREQILKDIEGDAEKKTFAKPNLAPPPVKEKVVTTPREPKEQKPRKEFKKRGRKNSEDGPDIDLGEYAYHKPSGQATLFDFIGGGSETTSSAVGKLVEQTTRMAVSRDPPAQKSFGRGEGERGGGRGGRGGKQLGAPRNQAPPRSAPTGRSGYGDPRPSRNDGQRPGKNEKKEGGNEQSHFNRESENNNRQTRPNTAKATVEQSTRQDAQRGGNRPNSGPSQQNKYNQEHSQDSQNFRRGPNQNQQQQHQHNQQQRNFQSNEYQHQPNFQRGPNKPHGNFQRGSSQPQAQNEMHRGPPRGNLHHQRPNHFQSGPHGNLQRHPRQQTQQQQHDFSVPPANPSQWRVGSQCLAQWTDGAIYPATIVELLPNRSVKLRYNEYGNIHTLPLEFLIIP